jgi:hypothetical protein
MEWYYHLLVYPQAILGVLPSYIWKAIVGTKDFFIEVQNTKKSLMEQIGDSESVCESDTETEIEIGDD